MENTLCMTIEHIRAATNPQSFYQCIPLSDQEIERYFLVDNKIGIWKKQTCPGEHHFDYMKQGCSEKYKLRRQQPNCQQNPTVNGCEKTCQVRNITPMQMEPCDWLSSTLQLDSTNNAAFLQCIPQQTRSCGIWTSRRCGAGTTFDARLQICTLNRLLGCPVGSLPVSRCAQQSFTNVCPGNSQCTEEYQVCCQSMSNLPTNYEPSLPISVPVMNNLLPQVCPPNTGSPVAACSPIQSCPPGTICYTISGFCCSIIAESMQSLPIPVVQPLQPQTPIPVVQQNSFQIVQQQQQIVIMCPNGFPGIQPCGFMEQCPANSGCYRGVCCPLTCPSGQDATGFCGQTVSMTMSCSQQASCISGCCCQQHEPIRMPICRSGVTAASRCAVDQECGPGMECSSGGCCPIPFCPTGIQAIGRCPSGMGCQSASICANGLCCPAPRCSTGVIALRICVSNDECGNGFECANGGCCPLPLCPNNQIGSQRCATGGCCCPTGQQCISGVCCPLPACSNGILSATLCEAGNVCPQGMECSNGGCCPLPVCPSGAQSSGRCHGNSCPVGQVCENGVCCPLPVCSNGQLAVQLCAYGNSCPIGYICEGRGCCLEPLPLCPNGVHAYQRCNRGIDCPTGFGCTAVGVCCLLSLEPVCPSNQNAICQCAPPDNCPPQTSCTMGTCCTSASVKVYDHVPGSSCQASSQCNGFNSGGAQCVHSVCACINGAASNGATCHQFNPAVLLQARSGCDQYGSPCKFAFSTARRKPLFAPFGNITEQPLWYAVVTSRHCLWNASIANFDPDSTCLPNEKCIRGECRIKLWPGEYACTSDEECSSRCSNTYCSSNSDKGISQCLCSNGKFLLYGRCLHQCPTGFHAKGAYCEHDDEDHFWMDGNQQNSLRELLNSGIC
ncbi:Sybindin-like family protein [Brugia malayi]|uniref:Bm5712, isoform a n=2 Tax=Brugia TaxID=6278 RepID=A0A0J9Y643_BRUMA|nr:Sybindin-like family protein [Brugia malayi]CDQ03142.1 Bm5712, isoform a [Brugia malayi]VIO89258.1 Sybindin-like family protein [Brugia malayi]